MGLTKEQIVAIIRKELKRQFEDGDLSWYTEYSDYVAVDGNPDLDLIADEILKAIQAA
jgi:hypothetical protein